MSAPGQQIRENTSAGSIPTLLAGATITRLSTSGIASPARPGSAAAPAPAQRGLGRRPSHIPPIAPAQAPPPDPDTLLPLLWGITPLSYQAVTFTRLLL
jgi:hypothetical protein